ncbi:myo-inosose-2 dehydratase [Tuberibacillus sp. Marseille-P3662]|uniref:myo-inosose-2 dehydratase n=1 Tax=Tuberibacillus sp. Marseille-P3662 TaxID=1965358 RepID=UPI0020CB555A|nr:myo-inosose-2 dehydratase [Tuberibacillus sp. Marseille-P3662]
MSPLNYEFKTGIAAISWVNDDIIGLGEHYSLEKILSDMQSIGYIATEMGRTFPQDLQVLKQLLGDHHLELASKFVGVLFSDPSLRDKEIEDFREWADFLQQMGCQYVITCEWGGSMHWDRRRPDGKEVIPLNDNEWDSMVIGLHLAAEICQERGMELVFHPHAGTVVEQKEEVDRLMETTDPNLVHLLYDTGHAYYGNYDPLEQLQNHYDRIKYVHYKDVRQDVLQRMKEQQWDFREGVLEGLFTVPGDGCIDFEPIIKTLMERGYQGWTIVEAEQDPDIAPPYKYAKMAKDYLDHTIAKIEKEKVNS